MSKKQLLIIWLFMLGLVSCSDEDTIIPDSEIAGITDEVFFEQVGDINSIGYREHLELLHKEYTAINSEAEEGEENKEDLMKYLEEEIEGLKQYEDSCINVAGVNWENTGAGDKNRIVGYEFTTINYKSIDEYGEPITLSSLVVWPYNTILSDPDADNVVIGCHVTITKDSERPSNYKKNSVKTDVGMIALAAKSKGVKKVHENLVIIPDYQGYGVSKDRVHPYLSQNLTARQVLDGVNAGIAYYQSRKHKNGKNYKLESDWRSISMGYSQGGSVALAVHRYIEQNNLQDKFKFAGSVCGDGPYDPVATVKQYIAKNKVYMPVAVALIVKGMCDTSPALKGKYTPEDFLTEKFINTGVLKMITDKNKSTTDIQKEMLNHSKSYSHNERDKYFIMYQKEGGFLDIHPTFQLYSNENFKKYPWTKLGKAMTSYAETTDVFQEDVIKFFKGEDVGSSKEKMKALTEALNDNILYNGWEPKHPTFLIHSQGDEVVPIDNYDACITAWPSGQYVKGVRYKGHTQSHVNFGSIFYLEHSGMGTLAIFTNTTKIHMHDRTDWGI